MAQDPQDKGAAGRAASPAAVAAGRQSSLQPVSQLTTARP